MNQSKSITLINHFFYPDDVISARIFTDMAEELVKRGWKVRIYTSNRFCRYPKQNIQLKREIWKDIEIFRFYRPSWDQSRNISRVGNALWLFVVWVIAMCRHSRTSCYIIGSDPQFSQILLPLARLITGRKRIVYWCYDLYPEVIIAANKNPFFRGLARATKPIIRFCYRFTDLIVDLGPYMSSLFKSYNSGVRRITLTPWAIQEPASIPKQDQQYRKSLFGEDVKLGLLYSGNLGTAHEFEIFLQLARYLAKLETGVRFTFAVRGNRVEEFRNSLRKDDTNIRVEGFVSEDELEKHLAAADIHILSLRDKWDGIVVPSKFFGALAVGRPVLYLGSRQSDIGQWLLEYNCGLILHKDNLMQTANRLVEFAQNKSQLYEWQNNAFEAYHKYFSKQKIMDAWEEVLNEEVFNSD